jgi:thiamine transporter
MTAPVIAALFAAVYFVVTIRLCRGVRLCAKSLALGGVICAATLILEAIYIPLPTGASIHAVPCVPLMLLALTYDRRIAFLSGWVCGVLLLVINPLWQPVHWTQIFVEHLVCFSCLGYAGIFGANTRPKILAGILLALFLKFCGHVLSGVVFFSQNAWDGWGAWAYSLTYHLTSKIPEGIATAAVLMLLPVAGIRKAIGKEVLHANRSTMD